VTASGPEVIAEAVTVRRCDPAVDRPCDPAPMSVRDLYRRSVPGPILIIGSNSRVPLQAGHRLGLVNLSALKTKSQALHRAGITSM
jgi:hypothetical protein